MQNKKGLSFLQAIIGIAIFLIVLWIAGWLYGAISGCETTKSQLEEKGAIGRFVSQYVFFCEIKPEGLIGNIKAFLGFGKNFEAFFVDLLNGLFIGLLIWGSYWLIAIYTQWSLARFLTPLRRQARADVTRLQSSWLNLIGGQAWKIIVIGILYAIIMQIPVINRFIEIIAFKPLELSWILQDILIAFYIAFLPGAIEAYTRFKLRKRYYRQIQEAKFGVKMAKMMARG